MKKRSQHWYLKQFRSGTKRWERKLLRRAQRVGAAPPVHEIRIPTQLSYSSNSRQTLSFFNDFKEAIFTKRVVRRRGKVLPAPLKVDLIPAEHMSVPCAVVLAAEMQRWSRVHGANLTALSPGKWSPRVQALLLDLGVLQLLGITERAVRRNLEDAEQIGFIRLKSGDRTDGAQLEALQYELAEASKYFEPQPSIFRGLQEAVGNAIEHAYKDTGHKPKFPYAAGHRWWAAGCIDTVNLSLRFFVYDQGIGIPLSLLRKPSWKEPIEGILRSLGLSRTDSNLIEGAFEVGRTSTGSDGRGKGLHDLREVIQKAGAGYLRILSGHGDVTLFAQGRVEKRDHGSHIGGTLIEWSIPLDVFRAEDADRDETQGL